MANFYPEEYTDIMQNQIQVFTDEEIFDRMDELGIQGIDAWLDSIDKYAATVAEWRPRFDAQMSAAETNPLLARALSDQNSKIDRAFNLPAGLPDRPIFRHSVISTSQFDSYGAGVFPGVTDLLYQIDLAEDNGDEEELQSRYLYLIPVHVMNEYILVAACA